MITPTESRLLTIAKEHSIKTRVIYGQPQLLSEWTQQGVYGCFTITTKDGSSHLQWNATKDVGPVGMCITHPERVLTALQAGESIPKYCQRF